MSLSEAPCLLAFGLLTTYNHAYLVFVPRNTLKKPAINALLNAKLEDSDAELIRKILDRTRKEGNSAQFFLHNLLNSALIHPPCSSLTFTFFSFAVYCKPCIFSPAFFLSNNFCLFAFFIFLLFINLSFSSHVSLSQASACRPSSFGVHPN